jgi:hypothetical protein
MGFVTIVGSIYFTKLEQEVNIAIKSTFTTKYFHKWKGHYTPYNYITLDFQEIVICFIIFLY